ncbi:MAG: response regulator [Deltaproteobacteria bacterium]|nr:response regulator [Deltaproteobacteria bacterium]
MGGIRDDLRWVLDALPVAVWVGRAPDGTVAYTNAEFERIMQMRADDAARIEDVPDAYGVFGRDKRPFPVDQLPFSRVLATLAPVVVDGIVLRRPGGELAVRAFAAPTFGKDGALAHVIVAFIDVTTEAAAQQELEVARERLALACNHAPIALWATDLDGTVTLSEGAALAALGVKPGQLVGQNLFDLYGGHPTVPGNIRRALAGESFWYETTDGGVTLESWIAPLRDASGAMIGLTGFSKDVTDNRRLQRTVIQNDRVNAVGTLAASVAHEINNPLTYVMAHADLLARELAGLDALLAGVDGSALPAIRASLGRIREDLAPIRSGTDQIATISRGLGTFNRADDAKVSAVDLRGVIDAVLGLVRKNIEARAELVLDLGDTPEVMGSHNRLVQVVLNLMMNALQALPSGAAGRREVSVRSYATDGQAVVEVGDSGPGVPAALRERIFEPFFTTKEIGAGTGLGLFVCRNIVRALNGDVTVADRPGGGAVFRVTLPAGARARAVPQARPQSIASTVGRHVLVIDDEAMVLRVLAAQLTQAGFRVTTADDGEAGLAALLASDDFDLAFCDLMMRGKTGMQIAAELSARAPERLRKVVFMTGGAFTPEAREFFATHGDSVVSKPFEIVAETRRRLT